MRAVIETTGGLREEDVPEPMLDTLVQAFRDLHGPHD
jgi:hypothetical protein